MGRWKVLRKNPLKPLQAPDLVFTWQDDKQRFLPLSNRLFRFLATCDMARTFRHRDRRHWAALFDRELKEREEAGTLLREKIEAEEFDRMFEGIAFMAKHDRKRIDPSTVNP